MRATDRLQLVRTSPEIAFAGVLERVAERPLVWALRVLVGGLLIGGTVFSLVEDAASVPDGVWWAFVSMTTVGYGDIAPKTAEIRLLATFVILTGICGVAIVTAELAGRIAERRITGGPDLHGEFDALVAHAQSLRDRYAREELDDDQLLVVARRTVTVWRSDPDAVHDHLRALEICLKAHEKE